MTGTYVSVPLGYHLSTGENPCRVLSAPQCADPGTRVNLRVFTWELGLEDWGEFWFSRSPFGFQDSWIFWMLLKMKLGRLVVWNDKGTLTNALPFKEDSSTKVRWWRYVDGGISTMVCLQIYVDEGTFSRRRYVFTTKAQFDEGSIRRRHDGTRQLSTTNARRGTATINNVHTTWHGDYQRRRKDGKHGGKHNRKHDDNQQRLRYDGECMTVRVRWRVYHCGVPRQDYDNECTAMMTNVWRSYDRSRPANENDI